MPLLRTQKIVIATHNVGKLREIQQLIAPYGIEAISAGALGLPEPEETGLTFAENAILKAKAAALAANMPALADDSGLAVAALDGAPGIYSARWAGDSKDFTAAMALVEQKLQAKGAITTQQRAAAFICVLAMAWPDGRVEIFEGRVDGQIVHPPRGLAGFGYDPQFLPDGFTKTFGQMSADEKHGRTATNPQGLSHRSRAFYKFEAMLRG